MHDLEIKPLHMTAGFSADDVLRISDRNALFSEHENGDPLCDE